MDTMGLSPLFSHSANYFRGRCLPFFSATVLLLFSGHCAGHSALHVDRSEALELRKEVEAIFYHAYDGYMKNAFPLDELRPMSCTGEDSLGGYALTLVTSEIRTVFIN